MDEQNELLKWKCGNLAYLINFLKKNYGNCDMKNPTEIIDIGGGCKQYVWSEGKRKVIYVYEDNENIEYFTKSTWNLFLLTLEYKKVEYKNINIFFKKILPQNIINNINFLENYIENISRLMRINALSKIEIYVIEKKTLLQVFGNDKITGFFDPLKGKIYIDELNIEATHEVTHSLMHQWGICTNLFCSESVAECFKRPIIIPKQIIRQINSFSEIYFNWNTLKKENYGIGGLFFRFLFITYGINTIKKICTKLADAGEKETEIIIKKITNEPRIIQKFVEWNEKMDYENIDWYFQLYKKGKFCNETE